MAEDILMKQLSARVRKALQKKVEDHNKKNPKHRATLRMLSVGSTVSWKYQILNQEFLLVSPNKNGFPAK